ncbi:hypothetical protein AGMMS50239_34600 [Bacteroidia bacterium]|nr:hypothetical protein AGMMS50239_34600 [Bacteroidia bacterium]
MNTLKTTIILFALFLTNSAVMAQTDDEKLMKKINTELNNGDCEGARKDYKVWKAWGNSPDSEIERKLAACGQSTTTSSNTPRKSYEPEMIFVQGGTFTMGCTSEQGSDCYSDEKPAHQVTLSAYYIGKYEVTQKQWQEVMGTNPSYFKGDNLPVEQVSWEDVQDFIVRLNSLTGKNYRLPTEAEWEYAARGGSQSRNTKYSGAYSPDNCAWYSSNSNSKTHPVGTKQANELGIYDMSGNVYEWCSDWYGAYSSTPQTNPTGATLGSGRVYRGGSWGSGAQDVRVPIRNSSTPGLRYSNLGFRLASSSK